MKIFILTLALLCAELVSCAPQRSPKQLEPEAEEEEVVTRPPVLILKQISQVNKDGSFTYGFEASDGSFRVETRDVDGSVRGKYGYIDEFGETKTVEYSAGKSTGFTAQGENIPVAPAVAPRPNAENEDDEDWFSVDADEDGFPDPPRPKEERLANPRPTKKPAPAKVAAPAPTGQIITPLTGSPLIHLGPGGPPPEPILFSQLSPQHQAQILARFPQGLPPGARLVPVFNPQKDSRFAGLPPPAPLAPFPIAQ